MKLPLLTTLFALTCLTSAAWPGFPHTVSGRWIRDATGKNVTYAGTNWPGHTDVMIPEGLQYQSIASIVSKIKSIGMNVIRLTFAIQMIDEITTNGGKDITLQRAFVQALGQTNGTRVLSMMLAKNPEFNASTTRLEVCHGGAGFFGVRSADEGDRSSTPSPPS